MKVTADKFQLPLAVADSAAELAEMVGTTRTIVASTVSHWLKGELKYPSYVCVDYDEE